MGEKSAFTPGCAVNQIILFQTTNRTTLKSMEERNYGITTLCG
jgi:hypothetical protein